MKRPTYFYALLIVVTSMAGCTTSDYWSDRRRDAVDIFTATVGVGGGGKVRAGPFTAGCLAVWIIAGCGVGSTGHLPKGA